MRPLQFRQRAHHRSRGQSLVEFALVFPIFMLVVGAIIQFGVLFWAQNTLTQVVRDTGRWAATQQGVPCEGALGLATTANAIARNSSLIGYVSGQWAPGTLTIYANNTSLPANPPSTTGIEAVWNQDPPAPAKPCPPTDNQTVWYVTVRASSRAPIFFPWIPGNGNLSSSAQFRMEPMP